MSTATFQCLGHQFTFLVTDPTDTISKRHLRGELYEAKELALLGALIKPGDVVLDIGANIGNHTVFFAKQGATVIAFEADPLTQELLAENLKLNEVPDVTLVDFGLSDKTETLGIYRRPHNLGATRLSSLKVQARKRILEYPATCVPLDSMVFERVDFIKIDVEQMEMKVLRGAVNTIVQHRPLIFIEVHDTLVDEVSAWADTYGYSYEPWKFTPAEDYDNWLMTPRAGRAHV